MAAFDREAFPDAKTARMEQRTTAAAKALIEEAARMLGINASEFTVAAATRAARETLRRYETTVLQPEDREAFLEALDATEPTTDMVDLMALHARATTRDGG